MEYRVESRHGRYLLLQVNNGATCMRIWGGGGFGGLKAQIAECVQLSQTKGYTC